MSGTSLVAIANRLQKANNLLTRSFPSAKQILPSPARRAIAVVERWTIRQLPDRSYMRSVIVPLICNSGATRVLFVGCQDYTFEYLRLFATRGVEIWTVDIDPAASRWGMPERHITADASKLDTIASCPNFDAILFSGVLGFGIDDVPTARRTFRGFARVLAPGALLVIGWNTDRTSDPRSLPEYGQFFEQVRNPMIAARRSFDGSTHIYDFLQRNCSEAG